MLFNEHTTTIITVNVVVNNVVLVKKKQPQAIHLAMSEPESVEQQNLVK